MNSVIVGERLKIFKSLKCNMRILGLLAYFILDSYLFSAIPIANFSIKPTSKNGSTLEISYDVTQEMTPNTLSLVAYGSKNQAIPIVSLDKALDLSVGQHILTWSLYDDLPEKVESSLRVELVENVPPYLCVDLAPETLISSYSFYTKLPFEGLPTEEQSRKLLLKACPPGGFTIKCKERGLYYSEAVVNSNKTLLNDCRIYISKPYYISVYELTQVQYRQICHENPSHFKAELKPVETISYEDVIKRCVTPLNKASQIHFTLPTIAQWEYAYWLGKEDCSNVHQESTHSVGSTLPNAWGLYDMCGNVMEWCQDSISDLTLSPEWKIDPRNDVDLSKCVLKGKSWQDVAFSNEACIQAAWRKSSRFGVRLVATTDSVFKPERISSNVIAVDTRTITPTQAEANFLIIDLSAGPHAKTYPIFYSQQQPSNGWGDAYKSSLLVLRLIQCDASTDITKRYAIGVFEITQKQYELVMGANPSLLRGWNHPVETLSYNELFNKNCDNFFTRLSQKIKMNCSLPTEQQWEYACRAGTTSYFNSGDNLENQDTLGCWGVSWITKEGESHEAVGEYKPNAWGLYDMHGNIAEWCLPSEVPYKNVGFITRGGSWRARLYNCRSSSRRQTFINDPLFLAINGIRLVINDLTPQKDL